MNESMRMVIVLSLIAIISGGSLAVVDSFTKPRIEVNKVKAIKAGLKELIPDANDFQKMEILESGKKFVVYRGVKRSAAGGMGIYPVRFRIPGQDLHYCGQQSGDIRIAGHRVWNRRRLRDWGTTSRKRTSGPNSGVCRY